ncbi:MULTISPECIES: hypothetical protein [Chryseobacterium]|uniref:Type II toxin-antitoxin system RelE/ParE family toxin n=1 Tax=Chryseobacterium camelliae TaxID=1265445 RepID=A0ABU0TEU1_9FLAO|nr:MULTISPECIES: hypothetical protein [Chryseobacterium]MDT3406680.1 hypothetical protein [Pseudacidovorax intermedius]MDQ1095522.1 hypothetical protein [Chryseobacterium camelliae]MDQ1099459.1 hypothetical protein [Chryseobacterium sp. SORGH_AS_1048]MDR6086805.1 hypothetical protein [Chryseobacterium sp. SORGH_AS_0909]MDR6131178.1 hypothetical protein [Chryseobacterium sp. SORGH_AS_1175]
MQERQAVVISEDVLDYLAELSYVLFKNGYFDYFENALNYVDDIYNDIFRYIYIAKRIKVHAKHRDFGDFYFVIKTNRRTAWHIYFIEKDKIYYITKILNNHLETARFLNM